MRTGASPAGVPAAVIAAHRRAERALGRGMGSKGGAGGKPPRCLQASSSGRRGAVGVRARAEVQCAFPGHGCGGARPHGRALSCTACLWQLCSRCLGSRAESRSGFELALGARQLGRVAARAAFGRPLEGRARVFPAGRSSGERQAVPAPAGCGCRRLPTEYSVCLWSCCRCRPGVTWSGSARSGG